MIARIFGLPGCGKTTILTALALDAVASGRYPNVYVNFHCAVVGVTYVPFSMFGSYELNGLYIVDEATINCGDRDWKGFSSAKIKYLMEHRHHELDVCFASQEADGMDKKIRSITDRVYYVYKGFWTGKWMSTMVRVPYKIVWPDGDHDGGENAGRILMGYIKPPFFNRLFAKRVYRPKYYKYFDSWECERLPPLPDTFRPYGECACVTESASAPPADETKSS